MANYIKYILNDNYSNLIIHL